MIATYRFIIVYTLLISAWAYFHLHNNIPVSINRPLAEFPATCEGWRMNSQSIFSGEVLQVLRPSDYLYRQYAGPSGEKIALYVGYHDGGKESGEIHSPKNCLPGNGWQQVSSEKVFVDTATGNVQVVRAVYQKNDSRELFLYWFQAQGKTLTDEYSLKLAQVLNSITQQRRDTAFVRISVPIVGDEDLAVATGTKFIKDFYPMIKSYLSS